MEVRATYKRDELPSWILERLDEANVFFSREYDAYTCARGERTCYLWSPQFVMPVRVKRVAILAGGSLDTEPFALDPDATADDLQSFFDACCAHIKRHHVAHWVETGISSCFTVYPTLKGGVSYRSGNLVLDLSKSEDELLKGMHGKQRNMVRRGEREGVEIVRGTGPELRHDYKSIEDQVWERVGYAKREESHYDLLFDSMPSSSTLAIAYKDGVPQAGIILLESKAMAYYHHGASRNRPTPGAHAYLMWREICRLREEGVRALNMEGFTREPDPDSKVFGIQQFKMRFGVEVVDTYDFKYVASKPMHAAYREAVVLRYHGTFEDIYDRNEKRYPVDQPLPER